MILLIDNYDSFAFNLARHFENLGQTIRVVRNDQIDSAEVGRLSPRALVLSPGPCGPQQAGNSLSIVRAHWRQLPIFGVCLGHQTIAAAFGASITRAPQPMHGRTTCVEHDGEGLFSGLPNPLTASRYHSLIVDESSLPDELTVSARTSDGMVMGLQHRTHSVFGVQFHPESILTESGYELLANFLRRAGLDCPSELPTHANELRRPPAEPLRLPDVPVTF